MEILYISYDGAADSLGQSQVMPYILRLSEEKISYSLLTFEKQRAFQNKSVLDSIRNNLNKRIEWVFLKYHKTPSLLATLYDIVKGFFVGAYLIKNKKIAIIHGRSFIGSVIALLLKKILKLKVILDMRGFWPEERVEASLWKKDGWLFKAAKFVEKDLIINADEIVVLTSHGKDEIEKKVYLKDKRINITVIPTCVNVENRVVERPPDNILNELKLNDKFVISYIGSVSTWYMPLEMFRFFNVAQKIIKNCFFLILTKEDYFLNDLLIKKGIDGGKVKVLSVEHESVPQYLSLAKIGLAFYKPGYSRKACCPTKFGEYLAQGLPVVINAGIGDCNEVVLREKVGVIINEFSSQEYERAAYEIKDFFSDWPALRNKCRETARRYFSLQAGAESYRNIYNRLSLK